MLMKISNDTVWNQIRDLPACSAVPERRAAVSEANECKMSSTVQLFLLSENSRVPLKVTIQ